MILTTVGTNDHRTVERLMAVQLQSIRDTFDERYGKYLREENNGRDEAA